MTTQGERLGIPVERARKASHRVTNKDPREAALLPCKSSRIPLNTFAIPFGLLGLARSWSTAVLALQWPAWIAEVFWVIAAVALLSLLIGHGLRGRHAQERLVEQLRHPAQAPVAAIVPVGVMLIGAHLHPYSIIASQILVYAAIVASLVFAGWLIAGWITQGLVFDAIHGGYLLPTVAAGFIAAEAAAAVGNTALAVAGFGVGLVFWVVIFTLLLARVAFRPTLPDPLMPTLAILAAPPAVGGLAWFSINGNRADAVGEALLGITVLMMVLQIALLPTYRRLAFSLGFWSFTFPFAAVSTQLMVWSSISRFVGWQAVIIVSLASISILIAGIAIKSLQARSNRNGTKQLLVADNTIESATP